MKLAKLMMAAAVAAGTMFVVTGCGDAKKSKMEEKAPAAKTSIIDEVKNSVFQIDKSRTFDTVFNLRCRKVDWSTQKNAQGQTIVKAWGIWKDTRYDDMKGNVLVPCSGDVVNVTFVVNLDNTFEISRIEFRDILKNRGKMISLNEGLHAIYFGSVR